jgi:hypothetical protein
MKENTDIDQPISPAPSNCLAIFNSTHHPIYQQSINMRVVSLVLAALAPIFVSAAALPATAAGPCDGLVCPPEAPVSRPCLLSDSTDETMKAKVFALFRNGASFRQQLFLAKSPAYAAQRRTEGGCVVRGGGRDNRGRCIGMYGAHLKLDLLSKGNPSR